MLNDQEEFSRRQGHALNVYTEGPGVYQPPLETQTQEKMGSLLAAGLPLHTPAPQLSYQLGRKEVNGFISFFFLIK